ncbi:hypothetical protein WICANDRAFT_76488 [Wickerhamomyces anomalus NRRL Y-366-8]|uniref:Uncharacterized protein n=1 Tax=Wickerhamomyces anomalus (strain ATCC 58044 / CBS 1984 / NCYC 433 / NRRL Y-366-8) TaxID=683960 RepID=A0A1E3PA80_WICAA|nr:uncharacterized protein WICANDRAFT_76488 [Wickerhamomyces anomalus NRRL Y-366-8]ODQ62313.1 hypothetical protein WICANDRAFT_76488 [Wickerhamomyces anomalus NRRL Y-366-8]
MSEQAPKNKSTPRRRYYNKNKNKKGAQKDNNLSSNSSSSASLSSLQSNKSRSAQRKPQLNPADSRDGEIRSLIYKLSILKTFKLINSNSKQKTFRIDINNDSYKFLIPIDKKHSTSIQSIEELSHNKFVIRNFNSKAKSNDKSLLFYVNYLINNYENLSMNPSDYQSFEVNKLI